MNEYEPLYRAQSENQKQTPLAFAKVKT
jgi:hypothetical protein